MTLEVSHLVKCFGGLVAVSDLSFTARPAQVTALIGPNGAGKTTALNTVSGVLRADGGSVVLDGKDVTRFPAHRLSALGMARTYQNLQVFDEMTVLEMVMTGAHRCAVSSWLGAMLRLPSVVREERMLEQRARAALRRVGLDESIEQREPRTLAYGLQRRVELARALAGDPSFVLLDEPAAGLNPRETNEMADLIGTLKADGLGILLVEHDMGLVMRISDQVVVMNFGKLIARGSPAEVQRSAAVIEAYLGGGFSRSRESAPAEVTHA